MGSGAGPERVDTRRIKKQAGWRFDTSLLSILGETSVCYFPRDPPSDGDLGTGCPPRSRSRVVTPETKIIRGEMLSPEPYSVNRDAKGEKFRRGELGR